MSDYQILLAQAAQHHGGEKAVLKKLGKPKSNKQLKTIPDDRILAEMAACIFRAGFIWRVVNNKWDGFEEVFKGFNPRWLAFQPPETLEQMAQDPRIIRNFSKVKAVYENAIFLLDIEKSHGGFGNFLSDWPNDDVVGLWLYLKKHGSRLGGNSGQYFLRFTGKDTFILSRDVCRVLHNKEIISKENPSSQKDLKAAQAYFNELKAESGLGYTQLSQILAYSTGPN